MLLSKSFVVDQVDDHSYKMMLNLYLPIWYCILVTYYVLKSFHVACCVLNVTFYLNLVAMIFGFINYIYNIYLSILIVITLVPTNLYTWVYLWMRYDVRMRSYIYNFF